MAMSRRNWKTSLDAICVFTMMRSLWYGPVGSLYVEGLLKSTVVNG